jgi:spore coat protein JB
MPIPYEEALAKGSSFKNLYIPYKFIATQILKGKNQRQNLLALIDIYGFIITDLNLYLDTHPNCMKTKEIIKNAKMELEKIKKLYNDNFPALTICDNGYESYIKGPWPWEDYF